MLKGESTPTINLTVKRKRAKNGRVLWASRAATSAAASTEILLQRLHWSRLHPQREYETMSVLSAFNWFKHQSLPRKSLSSTTRRTTPAKRQKVDTDVCVICKQKGHVPGLQTYYKLPTERRSQRSCNDIAEELGVPNCFVCRGDSENIVPLEKDVMKVILPKVRKKPRLWNADYAKRDLVASISELRDLTLNRYYLFSLDAGLWWFGMKMASRSLSSRLQDVQCCLRQIDWMLGEQ